jgi:hypothetical protein
VPDTKRKGFAEECRRQCLLVRKNPEEKEILEWCEKAAAEVTGWKWDGDL